jgi:hypothetical protein
VGCVATCLRGSSVEISVRLSRRETMQSGEVGKRGRGRLEVALLRVGEGECRKAVKMEMTYGRQTCSCSA